ncbi:MAG TPA: helix-turn-helix domain-containing protein [Jatrophihabitans sp.]|nr:helix-turn-helix domain-containing protein [Jatrophihabitans sp.]
MKDFREHLRLVRRVPDMATPVPAPLTFDRLAAYLEGMNAGSRGALLDGFREYCILRLGTADHRVWPTLVRRLRIGDLVGEPLTPAQDADLVEFTFELLDEFLAEPDRQAIHREHLLWLQRQPGYDPIKLRFGSTPAGQMLTVREAARQLNVDRRTVFDLIAQGRLTVHRSGAEILLHPFNVARLANNLHPEQRPVS